MFIDIFSFWKCMMIDTSDGLVPVLQQAIVIEACIKNDNAF